MKVILISTVLFVIRVGATEKKKKKKVNKKGTMSLGPSVSPLNDQYHDQ